MAYDELYEEDEDGDQAPAEVDAFLEQMPAPPQPADAESEPERDANAPMVDRYPDKEEDGNDERNDGAVEEKEPDGSEDDDSSDNQLLFDLSGQGGTGQFWLDNANRAKPNKVSQGPNDLS